jgi:hypothetical protein
MEIGASALGAAGGAGAEASFGGSAGASVGAAALGAAAPYVAGLFVQGGKIVSDIANVGSSFLVGSVTSGTTPNPYGQTLSAQPNVPVTAPGRMQVNTFNGMDVSKVFQELDLRDAQDQQAQLAHRRAR